MRSGRMLLWCATLLGALGLTCGHIARAQDDELFLERPEATYRGRVLDAVTDRPIPGAVVVIFWDFIAPEDGDRRNAWALREVLTDANGEVAIDASAIEAGLPPRAFAPRVLIYRPGYSSVPAEPGYPPGAPARQTLVGASKPIRLQPVRSEDERTDAINSFVSHVMRLRYNIHAGSLDQSYRMIGEELERFLRQSEGQARPGGSR